MNPQKAFNFYFGLNLHFNNKDYSILKYGANTKQALTKFNSLSTEQKFKFEWLSRRFVNTQDLVYACIATQFDDINIQFDTKESIVESYLKFKGRRESLTYNLKNEISKYKDMKFEKLLFKYFSKEVSPEYILLISNGTALVDDVYVDDNFSFSKPKILKLIKYKDFLPTKKYLPLFVL